MPLHIIGPAIALAVNLPLAAWALLRGFRTPTYRLFALFALSLILWHIGGQFPHARGSHAIWLRLSFFGISLAPAAFLSLAVSALDPAAVGRYWRTVLFLPALVVGLLTHVRPEDVGRHPLHIGFYNITHSAGYIVGAMAFCYIGAALIVSAVAARRREENGWVFRLVILPLSIGLLLVFGASWLRGETTPTLAYWTMVMAQVAMFMMIRYNMVSLEVPLTRGTIAAFSAVVVAACILLIVGLSTVLLNEPLTQEGGVILVVSVISLLVMYAAILPRIEDLLRYFFRHRDPRSEKPS